MVKKTKDIYIPGEYNIMCWICGIRIKRSDAFKRSDGRLVCKADNQELEPRDADNRLVDPIIPVRFHARPEPPDFFIPAPLGNWELIGANWEDITDQWETTGQEQRII